MSRRCAFVAGVGGRGREADVQLCGPQAFMREQWQALLGLKVPAERIHREVFGPELLDHLR